MQDIYNLLLEKIDKSQISLNEPMSGHTTFKIGGPADLFIKTYKIEQLKYIIGIAREEDIPIFIMRKPEVIY